MKLLVITILWANVGHYLTIKITSSQNHGPKLFCRSGGGKRLKLLAPLLALLYSSQQSWILIFQIFIFIRLCPSSIPFSFKYPLAAFIVQLLSRVWLLVTPWTAAHLCPLSYAISREFTQTHVHWVRDAIQLSHPLSLPSSPAFNLSQDHDLFQLIDSLLVPTFSISPSNEYSGLISFLIDWFDLLAVWGTLESLLQNHNSKASILGCSAFFMIWLSHLYMTTGKTIALITGPDFG